MLKKALGTAFLMTAWLAATSQPLHSQTDVIIKANHEKLGDVLEAFQKQSQIRLVYVNSMVDSFRILCQVRDHPFGALKKILLGTPFDFIRKSPNLWVIVPRSQTSNLSAEILGVVLDAGTQLPIANANVYLAESNLASTTDGSGAFSLLHVPPGQHRLVAKRIGYHEQYLDIHITGNSRRKIEIALQPRPVLTPEIVVEETNFTKKYDVSLTQQILARDQLSIPPLRNDGEIFEVVHQQPGVTRRDLDDVFPHIEGGSATEVMVELDGIPVYVPTYGQNRRSIFPAPVIESLTLHRSGYDVRYGEAMSGVIQLDSKELEEIPYNTLTSASLSGIAFNFKKKFEKLGWTGAWRSGKTNDDLNFTAFQGHDFFNKFEFSVSEQKRITLVSLFSQGRLTQSNSQKTEPLFNQNVGLRYDAFSEAGNSFSLLVYRSALQGKQHEEGVKWQLKRKLSPAFSVTTGLHFFNLHSSGATLSDTLDSYKFIREPFLEFGSSGSNLFGQDAAMLTPYCGLNFEQKFWQLAAGLRMPANLKTDVLRFDPRASFSITPTENLKFSVAGGYYHQFTDRSYASEAKSGDKSGTGEYLIKLPSATPSVAKHLRGETTWKISPSWTTSLSYFRKNYHFHDRAYLSRINEWLWILPLENGASEGAEFWLGKTSGTWQGWASFTLNHETYASEDETSFRPYFNRERMFNISVMHYVSSQWLFKWQFLKASGYPDRNWNPDQVKIDPGMSAEEFVENYLINAGDFDSVSQIAFGVNWFFTGFAKQSTLNLVTVRTLEEQKDGLLNGFEFWASLSFAY